jgi:hypothetical protein
MGGFIKRLLGSWRTLLRQWRLADRSRSGMLPYAAFAAALRALRVDEGLSPLQLSNVLEAFGADALGGPVHYGSFLQRFLDTAVGAGAGAAALADLQAEEQRPRSAQARPASAPLFEAAEGRLASHRPASGR